MTTDERDEIHQLRAREAIRQQLHHYCRAMDRRDDALGLAVWHETGTADYGADVFQGLGHDFVRQVSRSHLRRTAHSHQIATVGIVVAGESAASEAYATIRLWTEAGDGYVEELFTGRYLDRWSLREGRWAIEHRVWVLDFAEADRRVSARLPIGGRRDREDPSYALFDALG